MDKRSGFTIIELLIVIVIIGVLAAIVIISYNGITGKATDASMQTDAREAARILESDKALSGTNNYPADAASANGGKGLRSSSGNTYTYTPNNAANPPSYTLTVGRSGSTNSYQVTSINSKPTLVTGTAPVITVHPTGWIGFSTTFTAAATGSPSPTVQWQKSLDNSSWANVPGATNTTLTTSDYIPCAQTFFRAVFTNSAGSTATNSAYLEGPCGD